MVYDKQTDMVILWNGTKTEWWNDEMLNQFT